MQLRENQSKMILSKQADIALH